MSNVLDDEKQHQIRALGRLGWTLSRIEETTGIRRETISGYLRAAGIAVRGRGRPSESKPKPAISTPARTVSVLPIRCPHGAPRWVRGGRGRVLQRASRVDRPPRRRAMERSLRPLPGSEDRSAPAGACPSAAR